MPEQYPRYTPESQTGHLPESQKIRDYEAELEESGQPFFYTGYGNTFHKEVTNLRREQLQGQEIETQEAQDLQMLFQEIDRQTVENLEVVPSNKFPGVSYTRTRLTIDAETLEYIYQIDRQAATADTELDAPDDTNQPASHKTIAMFAAFAAPPDGHALTMGDAIIDRFIKEMPSVSNGRAGSVTIEVFGAPTGLGGTVTPEWRQAISDRGEEASAELYLEYFQDNLLPPQFEQLTPEQQQDALSDQQFLFQGISRGALIAKYLAESLPESVQDRSQVLMNNPAGHHGDNPVPLRAVKGAQMLYGLGGEILANFFTNPLMKDVISGPPTTEYIKRRLNLPEVDEQKSEKMKTALSEGVRLAKGHIIDKDEQQAVATYITMATGDPLTTNLNRIKVARQQKTENAPIAITREDEQRVFIHQGQHFYSPYINFSRWLKINQANRRSLSNETPTPES